MTIKTRNRWSLLFVAVFVMVVSVVAYPRIVAVVPAVEQSLNKLDIKLGLDLQGGIHLEYLIDLSAVPEDDRVAALDAVQAVVERRVNAFGVGEPIVQRVTVGDEERLIVQLPGVKDIEAAKALIKETPFLEFREAIEMTDETQKVIDTVNELAKSKAQEVLGKALAGDDFAQLAKEFSVDAGSAAVGGDLGFAAEGSYVAPFNDVVFAPDFADGSVYPELVETQFGWHIVRKIAQREVDKPADNSDLTVGEPVEINDKDAQSADETGKDEVGDETKDNTGSEGDIAQNGDTVNKDDSETEVKTQKVREVQVAHILLAKKTIADFPDLQWKRVGLTGQQLDRADFDPGGNTGGVSEPGVLLYFNDEGKKIFADITTRNVGKQFAIFLDDVVISAPVIQVPITDGVASITGNFQLAEAKALAGRLNEGALPAPITLIGQQSVDASLGADSLKKGLFAGAMGLLATMIYIMFYYRFFGLVAAISLVVYAATLVTLFKLSTLMPAGLSITLTLSGIAGFILSIGMAIDANILIFERIREERRRGKTLKTAVAVGFERAWSSIRDGNVSTLITCTILIAMGTGFVQGFAMILFIGVIVSMFTAIVLVRFVLRAIATERLEKMKWLIGN